MTKNKLNIYKAEQLLIVHWNMLNPLDKSMNLLLNDKVLAKPFLAVQMGSSLEMMLIVDARNHKLNRRKNSLLIQSSDTEETIAQCQQSSIILLPKKLIQSFFQEIQARFYTRLLVHTQEKIKDFTQASVTALSKRYACTAVQFYQLDQEQYFLRVPWEIKDPKALLVLNFSIVTEQGVQGKQKPLALYLDNALHIFFKSTALTQKATALISYSALGTIPVSLAADAELVDREEILIRLTKHSAEEKTLESFITPQIKPSKAVTPSIKVDTKTLDLSGKVMGIKHQSIVGWAQNNKQLDEALQVDIYENEQKLGSVIANKFCLDVGLTPDMGQCAFAVDLADELLQGAPRQIDLRYAVTGEALPSSPIKFGDGRFDFKLTVDQGEMINIAVQQRTLSNAKFALKLLLDGQLFSETQAQGGDAFELKERLPDLAFDGQAHQLQFNIVNVTGKLMYSVFRKVQHQYQGAFDKVDYSGIQGWLVNTSFETFKPAITVIVNDSYLFTVVCELPRSDAQQSLKLNGNEVGFEIIWPEKLKLEPYLKVALYYKGTDTLVLPVQTIVTAKDTMIRSLVSAAEFLKSAPLGEDSQKRVDANTWACQQIIEPAIKALRQQGAIPQHIQLKLSNKLSQPKVKKSPIIDVIIPVYQGYDETLQCLESVLQAKNNTPLQVHVLNDCSPDGRLKYKLQALAQERQFNLIENNKNLGFVATVNKGMHFHPDRDVLLLNSDTVVSHFWLDRICAAAAQNQNIATVTPFSNNATICSFPQFNLDNSFSKQQDLTALNNIFYQNNKELTIDLPTAIGFCMFIKREALLDIGYFDEQKWQQGYGEENDFCLRAASRGWRHVLACDVFVQHHGSVSFAGTKSARIKRNLALLNQLYPDYSATVQRFIKHDPIAPARNRVVHTLLKQQANSYLLFIMHGLGGGAKAHGDHLAHLLEQQEHPVLELSVLSSGLWQLQSVKSSFNMIYHYPEDYVQLLVDLGDLNINALHYHQTLGFPKLIWQLPEQLHVDFVVTAHDFMPICPRINLIDETGRFCQQAQFDVQKCQRCITLNGLTNDNIQPHLAEFNGSVTQWRHFYAQQLKKAQYIFCPSNSTAELYQQHFDLATIKVKPHPEDSFTITPPVLNKDENINVAVIGAIGDHKGYEQLLACATNALKEGLPLQFIVVGYTRDDEPLEKLSNVIITGAYNNAEQLSNLLQQHHCTLAAFLSVWPETYCYTLTEALRNNLYPVTLNYGAVAERLMALNYGQVINEYSTPVEINQALLKAGQKIAKQESTINYPGAIYHDLLKEYYHL